MNEDETLEPGFSMTQPPEPHHYTKHSDCCFTYTEGLDPLTLELEDLREKVKFLQARLEEADKKIQEQEEGDVFRDAYSRMRENFQVSLNTIRGLEDMLHASELEREALRAQVQGARAAMRIA